MAWEVEYTDEFGEWFAALDDRMARAVSAAVDLLVRRGPHLTFPYSTAIETSRYAHMRELRRQHDGRPLRVLYAFDPRRTAILLLGGDKTGNDRWYEVQVPIADQLYAEHLETLRKEGLI